MPPPLRFIPWFCGLPCEPMTLEVREEGPIVAEGGCPACRLEVALFHEEDRPPRVAGEGGAAGRGGRGARPAPTEGAPPPLILVPAPGAAGAATDRVLPVDGGADLDAALALRALVNGARPQGGRPGGVPVALLDEAALALRQARYSAILWDPSTSSFGPGVAIAMTLTLLGRDLNATTRSAARPLGAGGNVAGAVAALAAATGCPRAVSFAGGATRCAPGA